MSEPGGSCPSPNRAPAPEAQQRPARVARSAQATQSSTGAAASAMRGPTGPAETRTRSAVSPVDTEFHWGSRPPCEPYWPSRDPARVARAAQGTLRPSGAAASAMRALLAQEEGTTEVGQRPHALTLPAPGSFTIFRVYAPPTTQSLSLSQPQAHSPSFGFTHHRPPSVNSWSSTFPKTGFLKTRRHYFGGPPLGVYTREAKMHSH